MCSCLRAPLDRMKILAGTPFQLQSRGCVGRRRPTGPVGGTSKSWIRGEHMSGRPRLVRRRVRTAFTVLTLSGLLGAVSFPSVAQERRELDPNSVYAER